MSPALTKWSVCFTTTCLLCYSLLLITSTVNDVFPDKTSMPTREKKPAYKIAEAEFENKYQILSLYQDICNNSGVNINIKRPWTQIKSIVLVVVFNNPFYHVIPAVELLYRPFFPTIVYCISNGDKRKELKNWNLTYVYYYSHPRKPGFLNYICVSRVHGLGLKADGFLFMADDMLISVPAVINLTFSLPAVPHRLPRACGIRSRPYCGNAWSHFSHAVPEMTSLLHALSKQPKDSLGQRCLRAFQNVTGLPDPMVHGLADFFFIPAPFMTDASDLFTLFHRHKIFLEVTVQYVLTCLVAPSFPRNIELDAIWGVGFHIFDYLPHLIRRKGMRGMHPVKLSNLLRKDPHYVKPFCNTILPFYHHNGS